MFSRVCLLLFGAVFVYYQVNAEDIYTGELIVESNVTMVNQTVLSLLNTEVNSAMTILGAEVVAECLEFGNDTNCKCSAEYRWSNEMCYGFGFCTATTYTTHVPPTTPFCIAKVKVYINGCVKLLDGTWNSFKDTELETAMRLKLNGYESLNITDIREENKIVEFMAVVSVKLNTTVLQQLLEELKANLSAEIKVDTVGMVRITAPNTTVNYKSDQVLTCTLEEASESAEWKLIKKDKFIDLSSGSVVTVDTRCETDKNCVSLTLKGVTDVWSGTYECRFRVGSVTHTARAELSVALLPEVITMETDPRVADCGMCALPTGCSDIEVTVTATIQNSTEPFTVVWDTTALKLSEQFETTPEGYQVYAVRANVSCHTKSNPSVTVTFQNTKQQSTGAKVDITVIYLRDKVCPEEIDEVIWPKTPAGSTATKNTCEEGKTGYKSRTCERTGWQPVVSYCIRKELKAVVSGAENFEKGLGASQKSAMLVFEGLKNTTAVVSDDSMAEIHASITVIELMARASKNFPLKEDVFPSFISAASNMLNQTWEGYDSSALENISSIYLESVEDLVHNINVNQTFNYSSQNLELKVCSRSDCNMSVFGVSVNLNEADGQLKVVAVKNLVDKLSNNANGKLDPLGNLLIIATLNKSSNSPTQITMDFPNNQKIHGTGVCVFWDRKDLDWSEKGCKVDGSNENNTVKCKCEHLSAFSIFSKNKTDDPFLELIAFVGLGVSICSLVILLIIEYLVWSTVVKTNLSHFRHTALVNISIFLLLADCSFLASMSPESLTEGWCLILTICKHLFLVAMFCWMLCMSVTLIHQLIFVFSPLRKQVFMFLSGIIGYVCPVLIVGFSYVYCIFTDKDYYNRKDCWLVFQGFLKGSIYAFFIPVGTVICTNMFSMVVVILTLLKTSVPVSTKTDDKETAKSIIKVVVFLTPVFGVTWGIGFLLRVLEGDDVFYTIVEYIFTISNSFQGLFILLAGCFSEPKVREELLKRMCKRKYDAMKSSTSNTKVN